MRIVATFVTMQSTILSSMIHCIDMVYIPFSDDSSPMTRLNKFLMISIQDHVAVIFLGWLQLRKSCALAIYGLLFLKIIMRLLRNAHPVNIFIQKSALILLRYTPSLSLALFPNGGSIICIVSLPQPGGMVTSLYP